MQRIAVAAVIVWLLAAGSLVRAGGPPAAARAARTLAGELSRSGLKIAVSGPHTATAIAPGVIRVKSTLARGLTVDRTFQVIAPGRLKRLTTIVEHGSTIKTFPARGAISVTRARLAPGGVLTETYGQTRVRKGDPSGWGGRFGARGGLSTTTSFTPLTAPPPAQPPHTGRPAPHRSSK